jgi:O-antigen ligase
MLCLFTWRRRGGLSWGTPLTVVVLLGLLYIPFRGVISERLLQDDRGSAESRMPLMRLAFRIIEDNPVLGVGNNNFAVAMNRYVTSEFRRGFLYTVHNKYMLVWAETGTCGLLAYLAFFLGTVHTVCCPRWPWASRLPYSATWCKWVSKSFAGAQSCS